MPDLREAFRLSTDHVAPTPGALERQLRLQRRRTARRKASAFVAVAAVIVLVAVVILATKPGRLDDDGVANVAPGLFTIDIATGAATPFRDPGEDMLAFELSPDGTRLLMSYRDHDESKNQLWIADADGTDAEVLVRQDASWGTWFPDGERIAYSGIGGVDVRQIQVLDLTTGERTQLTNEPLDAVDPEVSSDGQWLVYATTRPTTQEGLDTQTGIVPSLPPAGLIRRIDLSTGQIVTLFRQPKGWTYNPDISPTTGAIAFDETVSAYPNITGNAGSAIWILADGEVPRTVISKDEDEGREWLGMPLWSPDGSLLAYVVESPEAVLTTWVYDPATGVHRLIAQGWLETWIDDDTVLVGRS